MKTIRFKSLYDCALFSDGWVDCLREIGAYPRDADYFLVRVRHQTYWLILLVDKETKKEIDGGPRTCCNFGDCEAEELEQIAEATPSENGVMN